MSALWNRIARRRELRRLRQQLATVKAENDRVFFHALDNPPAQVSGKARTRWALDVLKTGDEYAEEKALLTRIGVLEGRYVPRADGTYLVRV